MTLLSRLALCAFTGLAGLTPAIAAPITYSEGADLDSFATPSALGTLGVGLNTVSGTVRCTSSGCSDRSDLFSLQLAASDRIVSAQLSILAYTNTTERPGSGPKILAFKFGSLQNVLPGLAASLGTEVFAAGELSSFTGSVSGAGDLVVRINTNDPALDPSFDPWNWAAAASYELRIVVDGPTPPVTAVPEPASLALSLAGLAAALTSPGLARRRRPAQTDHA
jgi:hypothetical protein